jgi:hypothetical protein
MKVFRDRYGRVMRVVFNGITIVRLQDNRGRNHVMSQKQFIEIL